MNSNRLVAGGLIVMILLLGGYLSGLFRGKGTSNGPASAPASSPPAAPAAPAKIRVSVHTVVAERLTDRLTTSGTVRASEQVDLVSEVAGKVARILFDEGHRVERGELLLELDKSELLAQEQRSRYRIELAETREARQRALLEQGVISQQDYDFVATELNVLRADRAVLAAQLQKTDIRAPFSGVLGLRQVSEGSFLSPQTRIATLQQVDPVKVDFTVPEAHAGQVRVGQSVTFRVKGVDEDFQGRIFAIEPAMDAETRSLLVRAQSSNPRGKLVPGAFAEVDLVVRDLAEALTVPAIAVVPDLSGAKVFVIEAGVAQARPVVLGIRTADRVQVSSGLNVGDQVVTAGIQAVKAGAAVEVVAAAERDAP